MGLDLRKVHVFKKVPNAPGQFRLAETHPAMGFRNGEEQVWLQDGSFYSSGGIPLKETPAWLVEAIKRVTPEALAECGYRGKNKANG